MHRAVTWWSQESPSPACYRRLCLPVCACACVCLCTAQSVYLVVLEVALALRHMHSRRVVHRGACVGAGGNGGGRRVVQDPRLIGLRVTAGCTAVRTTHRIPQLANVALSECVCVHSYVCVLTDVKPGNVLVKGCAGDPRGWTCKLADFGLSAILDLQVCACV